MVLPRFLLHGLFSFALGSWLNAADSSPVPTAETSIEPAATAFPKLANKIPFIPYSDFLYGREPFGAVGRHQVQAAWQTLRDGLRPARSIEELTPLLDDPNPKIRTLALLGLYETEDRRAIPLIFSRLGDDAPTFPEYRVEIGMPMEDPLHPAPLFTSPSTVGSVAGKLLGFVGYHPQREKPDPKEFDAWRASHLDHPDWFGWYVFRRERATQGTSSPLAESGPKLAALQKEIAAIPMPRRAWLLLYTRMSSPAEMLEALRSLGPDTLLAYLRDGTRKGIVQLEANHWERRDSYLLSHARELFRESDADELVAMGHYAAAAALRPSMASPWLHQALAEAREDYRRADRAVLVGQLAAIAGDAESDFAVRWFYSSDPAGPDGNFQSFFLHTFLEAKPAQWEKTLRSLISHPKFEQVGRTDIWTLAQGLNQLTGREICSAELLSQQDDQPLRRQLRAFFQLPAGDNFIPLSGKTLTPVETPLASTEIASGARQMELTADGKTLVVVRVEGSLLRFDAGTGKLAGELAVKGSYPHISFLPGGGVLEASTTTAYQQWKVSDWSEISLTPEAKWARAKGINAPLPRNVFNQTEIRGAELDSRAVQELASIWPGLTGRGVQSTDLLRTAHTDLHSKSIQLSGPGLNPVTLEGHSDLPFSACFSPDSSRLISTDGDGKIIVWDAHTGQRQRVFVRESRRYLPVAFLPDGQHFAACASDGFISIYHVETGAIEQSFRIPGMPIPVNGLAVHVGYLDRHIAGIVPTPDGTRLYALIDTEYGGLRASSQLDCWSLPSTYKVEPRLPPFPVPVEKSSKPETKSAPASASPARPTQR